MAKNITSINGGGLDCPVADDWTLAKVRAGDAFEKIDGMHAAMVTMQNDTKNLNQLPLMVEILKTSFQSNASNSKIPAVLNLGIMALLGIVIVVLILKDAHKDIKINQDGFEMRQSQPK